MGETISASAMLGDRVRFIGKARENPPLWVDYLPPAGEGAGYQPMELLLLSLCTCSGQTLVRNLRKLSQKLTGIEVRATGQRRDGVPAVFASIQLEFTFIGESIDPRLAERALSDAEGKYSPVWAMLKASTPIEVSFQIVDSKSSSSAGGFGGNLL